MASRSETRGIVPTVANIGQTGPVVPLLPYQQRDVESDARFKWSCWSRQTGKSFSKALRRLLRGMKRRKNQIFLSAGERQSYELMEKARAHCQMLQVDFEFHGNAFFEGTSFKQLEVRLPNGVRIIGLPANPRTARGFTGDVLLDDNSTVFGPGRIVATGDIYVANGAKVLDSVDLISGDKVSLTEDSEAIGDGSVIYGQNEVCVGDENGRAETVVILTPGIFRLTDGGHVNGIVWADSVITGDGVSLTGALYFNDALDDDGREEHIDITYDPAVLDIETPAGLPTAGVEVVIGLWSESPAGT